jgi:hypothetical protein
MNRKYTGSRKPLFGVALLAALALGSCSSRNSDPTPSGAPAASDPPHASAISPTGDMNVIATADTIRETGIAKWHLYTDRTNGLRMEGFDAEGHKKFSGRSMPPNQDGVSEYVFRGGILRVHPERGVVSNTVSADTFAFVGRLHEDVKQHLVAAHVSLDACSQATAYFNACAIAAAIFCGACAGAPEPAACASCLVALNFEAQARSAMDEACAPPPPPPCDDTCYSCGVNNGCGVYCGDCGGGPNICVDDPCSDPCGCFDQCPQGCGG